MINWIELTTKSEYNKGPPSGLINYGIGITDQQHVIIFGGFVDTSLNVCNMRMRNLTKYCDLWILDMNSGSNLFASIRPSSPICGYTKINLIYGDLFLVFNTALLNQVKLLNITELSLYHLPTFGMPQDLMRTAFGVVQINTTNFWIFGGYNENDGVIKEIDPEYSVFELSLNGIDVPISSSVKTSPTTVLNTSSKIPTSSIVESNYTSTSTDFFTTSIKPVQKTGLLERNSTISEPGGQKSSWTIIFISSLCTFAFFMIILFYLKFRRKYKKEIQYQTKTLENSLETAKKETKAKIIHDNIILNELNKKKKATNNSNAKSTQRNTQNDTKEKKVAKGKPKESFIKTVPNALNTPIIDAVPCELENTSFVFENKCKLGDDLDKINLINSKGNAEIYSGKLFKRELVKICNGENQCIIRIFQKNQNFYYQELSIYQDLKYQKYFSKFIAHSDGPICFIALKFYRYGSLSTFIFTKSKNMPITYNFDISLSLGIKLTLALHTLHKKGYIHNNITSDNIYLDFDPQDKLFPVICEFGNSLVLKQDPISKVSNNYNIKDAALEYCAPEIIIHNSKNKKNPIEVVLTTKSDVYATGIVLLELLSGKPAWKTFDSNFVLQGGFPDINRERFRDNIRHKMKVIVEIVNLVINCVEFVPAKRLNMIEIYEKLKDIKEKSE